MFDIDFDAVFALGLLLINILTVLVVCLLVVLLAVAVLRNRKLAFYSIGAMLLATGIAFLARYVSRYENPRPIDPAVLIPGEYAYPYEGGPVEVVTLRANFTFREELYVDLAHIKPTELRNTYGRVFGRANVQELRSNLS